MIELDATRSELEANWVVLTPPINELLEDSESVVFASPRLEIEDRVVLVAPESEMVEI